MSPELFTRRKATRSREAGFSLVSAIFLLVVLALLGALITSVTGMQQASGQLDLLGVRAYHSARAGMEWGAHQVLDPNTTLLQPTGCWPTVDDLNMPSCPASPTHLSSLGGSLSGFTVSVTCQAVDTTEGNRKVRVFQIVATACNQPSGGSCPNAAPSSNYVERQLQASLAKCKQVTDAPGASPRCACG
jgi:MSHA biogenesis protein MshP